jgi:3-oxoacyl-[acyl-carrier-protein] synthase-3
MVRSFSHRSSDDEETGLLSYESSTYAMDEAYLFLENHTTQSDPDTRYI